MFTFDGKEYRLVENPETKELELSPEDKLELNSLFDEVVKFNPENISEYNAAELISIDVNSLQARIKKNTLSDVCDGLKCSYVANYLYDVKNDYDLAEKYFLFGVELKYSKAIENYVKRYYLNHDFETSESLLIEAIECSSEFNNTVIPTLKELIKIHGKDLFCYMCILNECNKNVKVVINEFAKLNRAYGF